MAKIIVVAENYAFGPIGKLITICKHLSNEHEIIFIGFGTSYQLGSKERFSKKIKLNTNSINFDKKARDIFESADLLISVMDRSSLALAQKLNKPVIWIDTLFWWWNIVTDSMLSATCYIAQNSLEDKRNLSRYGKLIKKFHKVGPIVDLQFLKKENKKKQILIAFGGMEGWGEYKIGVDSNYPFIITEILLTMVDFKDYDHVLFTGNERIITKLSKKYGNNKFQFKTLKHDDFIKELSSSKISLITPGLETTLESFSYKIPTLFLPASNESQYSQLKYYKQNRVAIMETGLSNYYKKLNFKNKTIKEKKNLCLAQLRFFEYDKSTQIKIGKKINKLINNDSLIKKQLKQQNIFLKKIGLNGVVSCTKIIEDFIKDLNTLT